MDNMEKVKVDKQMDINGKNLGIISRPNASPGYWLCCLLPIAFIVTNNQLRSCSNESLLFQTLTIAVVGMFMQSVTFFICLAISPGHYSKIILALSPGLITHLLLQFFTEQTYGTCLTLGFGATLGFQYAYVRVVRGFPRCCTLGEACILVQGLVLFIINSLFKLSIFYKHPPNNEFEQLSAIMMGGLFCLFVICWILATFKILRNILFFYPILLALVAAVCIIPVTESLPIVVVIKFIHSDLKRVLIVIFYLLMAIAAVLAVRWQMGSSKQASTRVRKIFHVLIVLVYIPGLIFQCAFLYIASGVALAAFALLDLIRVLEIPPLANVLEEAFATLHDEKDAGNIALTPFCLLIGCSLPMWINACPCSETDSAAGANLIAMLAGILSVGIGDTAASVIGSQFGKHKWNGSNRSIEGSLAFILSQMMVIIPLYWFNLTPLYGYSLLLTVAAVVVTSVVEAKTDQIDNLVLPLIFYIIVTCR